MLTMREMKWKQRDNGPSPKPQLRVSVSLHFTKQGTSISYCWKKALCLSYNGKGILTLECMPCATKLRTNNTTGSPGIKLSTNICPLVFIIDHDSSAGKKIYKSVRCNRWYACASQKNRTDCCLQAWWTWWVLAGKVAGRAFEHRVPHVRPREDHLELVVRPGPCGKVLKEHHHLLKIQLLQLVRPLQGGKGLKLSVQGSWNSHSHDRQIAVGVITKKEKKTISIIHRRLTVNKKLADMYTRKSGR